MEGIRTDNEDDDKDDLSTTKKKQADKVGLFGLDFKIEKPKKDSTQKREDLLSLLTRKTVEVEKQEAEESAEEEDELLSPAEEQQIEQQIVLEHQAEYHALADTETDELHLEVLEAVDVFHDKILSENMDSTQALAETLAEISVYDEDQSANTEIINLHQPAEKQELTEEPVAIRGSILEYSQSHKLNKEDKEPKEEPKTSVSSLPNTSPLADRAAEISQQVERPEAKKPKETVTTIVDNLLVKKQNSIKSETGLNQVKKKLEARVTKINEEIVTKELAVRQAATEKIRIKPESIQELPSRAVAPEANHLHSVVAPENIGKVLINAETIKSSPRVETVTLKPIDEHIETISRADLLELSAKTLVDGSTLRQAYETNLITEKGLRRILIEHLRGGDDKKALRRELLERDKDFERDPVLRDKPRQSQSGNNSVNKLIMKVAPEIIHYDNPLPTTLKSQVSITTKGQTKKKGRVNWLDVGLVLIIAILLTLVLALVINRH